MKLNSLNSSYAAKSVLGIVGLVFLWNLIVKYQDQFTTLHIIVLSLVCLGSLTGAINNARRFFSKVSDRKYFNGEIRAQSFFIPVCYTLEAPYNFVLTFALLSIILFESRKFKNSLESKVLNWELVIIYFGFFVSCIAGSILNENPLPLNPVLSFYVLISGVLMVFFLLRHMFFLNSELLTLSIQNKNLDQEKSWYSDLFSLVSHNIRTPLATMYSTLEIEKLKNSALSESPGFEKLEQELNKVLSIVDQSFRQNAWLKKDEQKLADVKQMLSKQYPSVEFLPGIKREYFNMKITSAEATALFLGLDSTISNAIKYGGSKVLVTSAEFDGPEDKVNIVLKVKDDGMGMSEEVLKKYGTPFHSSRKSSEGSGLGVYFTHSLMKQLDWEIGVHSVEGEGTEVSFKINFDRDRLNS